MILVPLTELSEGKKCLPVSVELEGKCVVFETLSGIYNAFYVQKQIGSWASNVHLNLATVTMTFKDSTFK